MVKFRFLVIFQQVLQLLDCNLVYSFPIGRLGCLIILQWWTWLSRSLEVQIPFLHDILDFNVTMVKQIIISFPDIDSVTVEPTIFKLWTHPPGDGQKSIDFNWTVLDLKVTEVKKVTSPILYTQLWWGQNRTDFQSGHLGFQGHWGVKGISIPSRSRLYFFKILAEGS